MIDMKVALETVQEMLQLRKYDSSHPSSTSQDIFLQGGISVFEENAICQTDCSEVTHWTP